MGNLGGPGHFTCPLINRFYLSIALAAFIIIVLFLLNINIIKLRALKEKENHEKNELKTLSEELEKMNGNLLDQINMAKMLVFRLVDKNNCREDDQSVEFEPDRLKSSRIKYARCMEGLDWKNAGNILDNIHGYLCTFAEIYNKIPYLNDFLHKITEKTEEAANTLIDKFVIISNENIKATEEVKYNMNVYNQNDSSDGKDFKIMIGETRTAMSNYEVVIKDFTEFNKDNLTKFHSIEGNITQIYNALKNLVEISSQSKVIYINLSIEAVKLGENGKGFQVIVKEIQKLNSKTEEFVHNINQIMKGFQDFMGKLWKDLEFESHNIIKNMEENCRNSQNIMNSLINSYEITSRMFLKVNEANSSVQKSLDKISESLQFQDITRQQINNIIEFLTVISKNIEDQKSLFDFLNVDLKTEDHLHLKIKDDFNQKAKVVDEKIVLNSEYKIENGGLYDFHAN
jgi:chemotaxis regulatin CheY-phosphate phosphatase CheZ